MNFSGSTSSRSRRCLGKALKRSGPLVAKAVSFSVLILVVALGLTLSIVQILPRRWWMVKHMFKLLMVLPVRILCTYMMAYLSLRLSNEYRLRASSLPQ